LNVAGAISMPHLLAHSQDFTRAELDLMRRAFEAALARLGGAGHYAVERETACAIIGAAQCGCLDYDQLVTIGTAAGSDAGSDRHVKAAVNSNKPGTT
jgi:hypothetical protein